MASWTDEARRAAEAYANANDLNDQEREVAIEAFKAGASWTDKHGKSDRTAA